MFIWSVNLFDKTLTYDCNSLFENKYLKTSCARDFIRVDLKSTRCVYILCINYNHSKFHHILSSNLYINFIFFHKLLHSKQISLSNLTITALVFLFADVHDILVTFSIVHNYELQTNHK